MFSALDEAGNRFICTIEDASPAAAVVALSLETEGVDRTSDLPRLALIQGLPKGPKMDLIIRQAVEAGVSAVFPIQTSNCVVREKARGDREDKLERRRKIVREALQQSGSAIRTKVLPTETIELERVGSRRLSQCGSLRSFHTPPWGRSPTSIVRKAFADRHLIRTEAASLRGGNDVFKALG